MKRKTNCLSWSPAAGVCIHPQIVIIQEGNCNDPKNCAVHKSIPDGCNKCSRLVKRNGFAKGQGNPKSKIMIVSDIPQYAEKLERILKVLNLSIGDVYFTHLVKCVPPKDTIPIPNVKEIKNCSKKIEKEIRDVGPDIIIALGHTVTRYFIDPFRAYPVKLSNKKILIPTVRPSSMKELNLRKLKTDYKKVKKMVRQRR